MRNGQRTADVGQRIAGAFLDVQMKSGANFESVSLFQSSRRRTIRIVLFDPVGSPANCNVGSLCRHNSDGGCHF